MINVNTHTQMNPCIKNNLQLMYVKNGVGGYIDSNDFDNLPVSSEIKGKLGPLAWDIKYTIDRSEIINSVFDVKIDLFGINVVNSKIDKNNPKIAFKATVSGVTLDAEIGIDFEGERIYLSGYLDFVVYKKSFDITILKF